MLRMYSRHHNIALRTSASRIVYGAVACIGVLSSPAVAGEWTITPRIDVEQSFTDNARSVAEGLEADMITTTTAGVDVSGSGARLQLNFNYNISRDTFWDNSDLNGLRQSLLGTSKVETIEDFMFIDTRASITQQSLARGGGISASDRNVGSNDQSTVVNYAITPNFAHRYGNWAESDVRYSFNETRFLETDVGEAGVQPDTSRSFEIEGLVRSGRHFSRLSWELSTSRTFTNNNSDRNLTELSGEYAWSRKIALLGLAGREEIENSGLNADDDPEFFWRGGFRLTPGPRTSVRFEAGHRFGGANFSGEASYQFSSVTALQVSYEESVRTDRQALTDNLNNLVVGADGGLIDPNTGVAGDPNATNLDFLDQTTRQQNLSISLNGASGRNTYNLTLGANKRTQEPDETQDTVVTFGAQLNRRMRPNLDGGVSANLSVLTESANGIEDYTLRSNAFLSYRLMENFTGRVSYDFLHRDSDNNVQDVQENVVSVSLSKSF